MAGMHKVLCLRRGGLGDTLLMIPVLRALRAQAAGAELVYAGVADFAVLLRRYGVVDRVLSSEALALWALAGQGEASASVRARLRMFDWVLGDEPALAVLAPDRRVTVFDARLDERAGVPAAVQLLARAGLAGDAEVTLAGVRAAPTRGAPVVLHAGSGSLRKCWPADALRALAAALGERAPTQVVLGPAETERNDVCAWPAGVAVVVPESVEALADLLTRARAYVGHDAGPTHLAAALRVPTTALFVATNPRVWAPQGAHVHVVTEPPSPALIARLAREAN
jgi:ADP-heptose:LPS heptosyltransferase